MRNRAFQFNERDAEIIHYVHQLRVATLDHLAALTKRSRKTLERRLPKLRDQRYLRRLRSRPQKGLYVIGSEGVPALIEAGYAERDLSEKRLREYEWKDLTIPHALLLADVHARLLLLVRSNEIALIEWRHESADLWDTVHTPDEGTLPVRPDAYFVLEHRTKPEVKSRSYFFLEADVGTMSHARIALKLKAYAAYHREQRHVQKYGVPSFQVVIVTQSRARAQNLRAEFYPAMSAGQRRAYPILAAEDLSLAVLGPSPHNLKSAA